MLQIQSKCIKYLKISWSPRPPSRPQKYASDAVSAYQILYSKISWGEPQVPHPFRLHVEEAVLATVSVFKYLKIP